MSPEKDEELCKKYPNLYAQRSLPMAKTCMCWGFECGDGWYDLIDNLSGKLEPLSKKSGLQATQVKEKFGGLRFYTTGYNAKYADEIEEAIREAEKKSYRTCEQCGKKGKTRDWGWLQTLCEDCWEGRKAELKKRGHAENNSADRD